MTLIIIALTALFIAVIITDATRYVIPNTLNLAILALYPVLFFINPPEPWWTGLAAFAAMFVLGLGIFALGIMGGGDVKLMTVSMIWTGWGMASIAFLLYTALAGGVLAIAITFVRRVIMPILVKRSPGRAIPRVFLRKQPIPYGLAVASGFLLVLYQGMLPGVTL